MNHERIYREQLNSRPAKWPKTKPVRDERHDKDSEREKLQALLRRLLPLIFVLGWLGCDVAEEPEIGAARSEAVAPETAQARPAPPPATPGSQPRDAVDLSALETQAETATQIAPEAQEILNQFGKAYGELENVELNGVIFANLKAMGGTNDVRHPFSSSFQAPNKFRHEIKDQFAIGSTGERTYVFNKPANAYITNAAPQGRAGAQDLPRTVVELLQTQNPSLLFTLLTNPVEDLTNSFRSIAREPEITLDGKQYTVLGLVPRRGSQKLTMVIDPQTHLLRQLSVDLNPAAVSARATNEFKRTVMTEIIYTNINTQPTFAAQHFAWTPPEGAKDIATIMREQQREGLVGKPAPEFTLPTLDGTNVSLSNLRGQVVVLDFWASWCPPCVQALPHLGQLYEEKLGSDVKIYAVNVQEDPSVIRNFVQAKNLKVPVLIDAQAKVAEQYNVESLPRTVVINKQGMVTEVFSGLGPNTFSELRAAIDAASNGKIPVREKEPGTTAK